mmetsp:Transcript_46877/g.123968  ORF Transcript_46877/g.123968 Transcript_46877/m.123968 type:complete len:222 (-) Transcript_46877:1172-1837(-)
MLRLTGRAAVMAQARGLPGQIHGAPRCTGTISPLDRLETPTARPPGGGSASRGSRHPGAIQDGDEVPAVPVFQALGDGVEVPGKLGSHARGARTQQVLQDVVPVPAVRELVEVRHWIRGGEDLPGDLVRGSCNTRQSLLHHVRPMLIHPMLHRAAHNRLNHHRPGRGIPVLQQVLGDEVRERVLDHLGAVDEQCPGELPGVCGGEVLQDALVDAAPVPVLG